LIEVAFDTARTVVDMLYSGWFRRYPNILEVEEREVGSKGVVGVNGFSLFPAAAKRAGRSAV
jgi:hypothetical protein